MDHDPQTPRSEGLVPKPPTGSPPLINAADAPRGAIGGGSGRDESDAAAERPRIGPGSSRNQGKVALLLLIVVGAAAGYYYYQRHPPEPPEPVALSSPPPAPVRHLAPEGVFYLTTWVRVESNDGITGLPPGTGVKLVKPGVYLTPSGEMPLDEKTLTNDLDIARRAQGEGVAGKQIVSERQAIEDAKAAAMEVTAPGDATAAQLKIMKRDRLTKLLTALKSRKSDLESRRKSLSSVHGPEGVGGAGSRVGSSSADQEIAAAEGRLKVLSEEIADVEKTLGDLK